MFLSLQVTTTLLIVIVLPWSFSLQQTTCLSLRDSHKYNGLLPLSLRSNGNDGDQNRQLKWGPGKNDFLELSIDSFLQGEYDGTFADDASSPLPESSPKTTVENAVMSLRALDDPEPSHGAAVLLRFCAPLSRGERWGGSRGGDSWKELLRGSLTPTMLAKRLRVSEFAGLLDFAKLDVTEGALSSGQRDLAGLPSFAFVNAALYFEGGKEPQLMEFKLVRISGLWLIDSVRRSEHKLFSQAESNDKA